ncbi:MAG: hypothetical protein WED33_06840 [Bacteroidia bacterium]
MRLLFILLCFLAFSNANACDICGCSSGGLSGGLFPQFQNNLLGVRYAPSVFTHPRTPGNFNGLSQVNRDIYHDGEVFFRWFPKKKLQLWVNAPYRLRLREESLRTTLIQGLGDIQISGLYTLIQKDSSAFKWRHLLLAGGGVSLPTGKYQQRDETLTILPVGFQVGTGSWSASANLLYMLRIKSWGAVLQGDFRSYSVNERQFRKGNVTGAQATVFRQFNLGKSVRAFLNAGIRLEQLSADEEFKNEKLNTGSKSSWFNASIDFFVGSALISVQTQLPMSQDYAGNQPVPGVRNSLSFAWLW